jgi:hypothetical protein
VKRVTRSLPALNRSEVSPNRQLELPQITYILRPERKIMNAEVKKILGNPALELTGRITVERLKHAGVTVGKDLKLATPKSGKKGRFSSNLIKRLARG